MAGSSKPTAEAPDREAKFTQRAYTLRLRPVDPNDTAWRDALWATHEAVNKGAKVFGDWLLTLRGGLDHVLAELPPPPKGKERRADDTALRRNRRILLALSWLSVEDERGAPAAADRIVAYGDDCKRGKDNQESRNRKVLDALCSILRKRKDPSVPPEEIGDSGRDTETQPGTWVHDCARALQARIRGDAVWVNRSDAFDALTATWDQAKVRDDARRIVWHVLAKKDYLLLPRAEDAAATGEAGSESDEGGGSAYSGEGAGHRTRYLFGHIFEGGGGVKGKSDASLHLRNEWAAHLNGCWRPVGLHAYVPKRESQKKKPRGCASPNEMHRQMFSRAASRMAQIWTKQRQQEAARQSRESADAALQEMEKDPGFSDSLAALEKVCAGYGSNLGVSGEFRIRPRQITGWEGVVRRWAAIADTDPETVRDKRIEAAKEAQASDEDKKFGDANLFFQLADEEYTTAWRHGKKADHTILSRYVAGMKARSDAVRLKVAAYRHPDAYLNPIFCQFGNDLPGASFRRLRPFSDIPAADDPRAVELELWTNEEKKWAVKTLLYASSKRFDREIGSACDNALKGASEVPVVSRRGRLGSAAAAVRSAETITRVAGAFDAKMVKPREKSDDASESERTREPEWSAALSAPRRALADLANARFPEDFKKKKKSQLRWTLSVSLRLEGRGPWHRFIAEALDKAPFVQTVRKDETAGERRQKGQKYFTHEAWPWNDFNRPLVEKPAEKRKADEPPSLIVDTKAVRGDRACLILSRLPDLRVLSVDLGQRFAAGCAVWHVISRDQFEKECADARGKNGWRVTVTNLYAVIEAPLKPTNAVTKKKMAEGSIKLFRPATYCRRIGADEVEVETVDPATGELTKAKKPHPAPWARLDRQFVIKLQGENWPAREASNEELWLVHRLEHRMGLAVPLIERLVRAGWGKTKEQKARLEALEQRGWTRPTETGPSNQNVRLAQRQRDHRVDELMSATVQNARLALRRHADRARIAFGITADHKPLPGDRKFWFERPQDDDKHPHEHADQKARERAKKHAEFLQGILTLWYDLAVSAKWTDPPVIGDCLPDLALGAIGWWNRSIHPLILRSTFTALPALSKADAEDRGKQERYEKKRARWDRVWEATLREPLKRLAHDEEDLRDARERKAEREAISALLMPVAEALRKDADLRESLARLWRERWSMDEGRRRHSRSTPEDSDFAQTSRVLSVNGKSRAVSTAAPKVATSGWHDTLGRLRDWLLPRGLRPRPGEDRASKDARGKRKAAAMNVGGVSLTRIDALVEFRRALVQFRTAGTPWGRVEMGPDGQPTTSRREAGENYARHLLDVIDQLREQRSKQLASRVVEAALGVGSENEERHWDKGKRPSVLLGDHPRGGPRFASCHAVVIERLDDYKPDEVRGKRENRMLAAWRKADFKNRLKEACRLHGLHLREVMPNYTSRQCSRTGLPGVRCDDLHVDPTTGAVRAFWWKKALSAAEKKINDGSTDAEALLLVSLAEHLAKLKAASKPLLPTIRVPRKGGDLFVAAPPLGKQHGSESSATPRVLQADLNAAANIGLRALMDPDFPGNCWYVPAAMNDGYRVPNPKTCAGAACLDGWKLARDGEYYTNNGTPLAVADEESVKKAQQAHDDAKKEWEKHKKALAKESGRGAATVGEDHPLKKEYEAAKAVLSEAKKAAQKEIINLWQDPQADRDQSSAGRWRKSPAYWAGVRQRVIRALWTANGLKSGAMPDLAPDEEK